MDLTLFFQGGGIWKRPSTGATGVWSWKKGLFSTTGCLCAPSRARNAKAWQFCSRHQALWKTSCGILQKRISMKSAALYDDQQLNKETRMDVREIKKNYPLHLMTFILNLAIVMFAAVKGFLWRFRSEETACSPQPGRLDHLIIFQPRALLCRSSTYLPCGSEPVHKRILWNQMNPSASRHFISSRC